VRAQVVEYVAAFANADGGTLVFGVENDGTVTGCPYPLEAREAILEAPELRLVPPQQRGRIVELDGKVLLVFEVGPASRAVMVRGDGFPRREGDAVIQSSEELINRVKDAGLVASPEARVSSGALADLDVALVQKAMVAGGFSGAVGEYLIARKLADPRGNELVLRQGAMWLFAKASTAIEHPNLGVRVFRVSGIEQRVGAARNVQDFPWIEGNLLTILERTRDLVSSLVRKSSRLYDLFFRETPEYPPLAWQEALVNALAHRDYAVESRGTEVWLYEDRIEIVSPGGLLPEVEIAELLARRRVHASRNPRIARVLTELGVMRQQGEGIPRMIEEMELSWLRGPELTASAREFRVTLRNEPLFAGTDDAWTSYVRGLPLDVRQKRALVGFHDRAFQSGDYQEINRVDRDLAYRELSELVDAGLLRATGAKRGMKYEVAKPSTVIRASSPPKSQLIARMNVVGMITNSDYRDVFGVDRRAALAALAALVSAGVLEPRGERRGAHYAPGPGWNSYETPP